LLEPEGERALREPALHELPGEVQRRGSGRAVVVDVHRRDAGEAELVQRPLSRRRVPVAVPDERLVDLVVRDACIGKGVGARLAPHVRIVPFAGPRLLELGHPHPDDEGAFAHAGDATRSRATAGCRIFQINPSYAMWSAPTVR